ncbi:hypothetical protein [Bradyrhizobium genosp. SA-3]|uniref:hypothetical protein n=1 Tax=Bradyrhizobium genosp. SA-3 TaxID=508868 RepID=UPI0013EE4D14|nr:hypothetical protein [Bradyrhizobium genosp. SA-3]
MAGLVPAIHALSRSTKNVDARAFASPKRLRPRRRDKPGHDDRFECSYAIALSSDGRSRRGAGWPSAPAITQQLAGGAIDQVQARTGLTRHGNMRPIGWLVAKPILHVHAGLGALEDDLTIHAG